MLTKEEQLINYGWQSFEEYETMINKICKKVSGILTTHKNMVIKKAVCLSPTKQNVMNIYGELNDLKN